jgi:hypothetical protein
VEIDENLHTEAEAEDAEAAGVAQVEDEVKLAPMALTLVPGITMTNSSMISVLKDAIESYSSAQKETRNKLVARGQTLGIPLQPASQLQTLQRLWQQSGHHLWKPNCHHHLKT